MSILKNSAIAATLAATALATSSPAMARDYHRGNDNTAAIAIGAGVIGLAIGAIVASSGNDRDRDRRYHSRYHVRDGWYYNNGQYYNRSGQRYNRSDWQRRYGNDRYDRREYRYNSRQGNYGDYYNRRGY